MESAEEETKLSSDLDECPELWVAELGNYVIETHKRQKQVDAWFSRWIIVRINAVYTFVLLIEMSLGTRLNHCVPDVAPLPG